MRLLAAVCVATLLAALPTAAQRAQDQPVFRSTTRLIVQTVTVKDKNGKPIEGLTAKDFIVTEDGVPQELAFVEYQRLEGEAIAPQTAVEAAAAAPAAQTPVPSPDNVGAIQLAGAPGLNNAPPSPPVQTTITVPPTGDERFRNRRLLILYFDLSATPPPDQMRAFDAALKYVDAQMAPADLLAIMTFGGGAVRLMQDFTDNRAQLRYVLETLIYGKDEDGDGVRDEPDMSSAFGQNDAEFNIFNTDRQLSALQSAVTMLRPLPEQKSLLYFASGLRLNGTDNMAQLRATTNAAIRANVTIHPVDARGLVATPPLGDATRRSPGGIGVFTGRTAEAVTSRFQRSQDTLYALAKDTGGEALFDYNDLSAGIVRAAAAQTSYYILGYYSTKTDADGRYRRVEVSLAGGLSADLSYRRGYYAEKEFARMTGAERERQLEEALMLENPITDITIAMEVNYFQLNRAEYFVPLAVKIPGSELELARRRGAQRLLLDFIGEVKDDFGITYQNLRDKLDIPITEATAGELTVRPIQYETGFTLLPGKYVIKFLARDSEAGRIGTYQASFTIPNLMKEEQRIPISSVVLSGQRVALGDELFSVRQRLATDTVNPLVVGGQKLVPSVTRVFSTSRDLYVFLQAYQRDPAMPQPLVAFVTLYRDGVKIFETAPLAVTDTPTGRSNAVPLRFSVPLEQVPRGTYDCQVTVLDPAAQKAAFWRAPVVLIP